MIGRSKKKKKKEIVPVNLKMRGCADHPLKLNKKNVKTPRRHLTRGFVYDILNV